MRFALLRTMFVAIVEGRDVPSTRVLGHIPPSLFQSSHLFSSSHRKSTDAVSAVAKIKIKNKLETFLLRFIGFREGVSPLNIFLGRFFCFYFWPFFIKAIQSQL